MTSVVESFAGLLASRFPAEVVERSLLAREAWRPYPTADDRAGWEGLAGETRAGLIATAEARLGMAWPELPATLFLEFVRDGNRRRFESHYFARRHALVELVLGECAEGRGRFLDEIINGIWAICEESSWCIPAHSFAPRFAPVVPPNGRYPSAGLPDTTYPVVDLFAAETGAVLAWTHHLVGERLAALLPVAVDRLEREVRDRVLAPYREIDDWWWLGKRADQPVNNWNPWIHSNILAANLLLERDPELRERTVQRAIEGLDIFLAGYHSDGGCDEGTSYWGHAGGSLFDCLDLLASASDGKLDAFDLPLVREIGRYIYRAHIAEDWYVNFADGAARVAINAPLVYGYGRRIGDRALMAQGAAAQHVDTRGEWRGGEFERILRQLHAPVPEAERDAAMPLVREAWLDGIQVLTARERAGEATGLFLAAKGGHNAESHNHNDIGSFVIALDGRPVAIDVGVGVYTRQTFSADRYTIWTMQSGYHNLPVVNGYEQRAGREFAAREVVATQDDAAAELALDIAGAYPQEAGIRRWRRVLRLERGEAARVVLDDEYDLETQPTSLALHLMLADEADVSTPGVIRCAAPTRPLVIGYDPSVFSAAVESVVIDDARLEPVWGECVYRLVLTARVGEARGGWEVTFAAG
jgi:hypothetical protein